MACAEIGLSLHSLQRWDVVKNRFQHCKTRYRGLAKNTAQMFSLFGLANLLLAKRYLIAANGMNPS